MNRQIGVKVSKFLVVSVPLPTGHVTQRMRIGHFFAEKRFTMGTLQSKLPLIIIVAPESCTVNRQIGVKLSKFLVVTGPLLTGHVTQRMRNGHFRQYRPNAA